MRQIFKYACRDGRFAFTAISQKSDPSRGPASIRLGFPFYRGSAHLCKCQEHQCSRMLLQRT